MTNQDIEIITTIRPITTFIRKPKDNRRVE